jgi:hypothetical protein
MHDSQFYRPTPEDTVAAALTAGEEHNELQELKIDNMHENNLIYTNGATYFQVWI